jgi:signal peptidase complex subunit 2
LDKRVSHSLKFAYIPSPLLIDLQILTERLTVSSKSTKSTPTTPPKYSIDISYLYSANGGKTIIKRGRETGQKAYNAIFDSDGYFAIETFEQWIEELVSKATSP